MKSFAFALLLKTTLSVLALISVVAVAQNHPMFADSLTEASGQTQSVNRSPVVPTACNPCLWYSGDLDPNNPRPDGTDNDYGQDDEAQVWVPFVATSNGDRSDKHVEISEITFNELAPEVSDFSSLTYGLRTGVSIGNGGISIAAGTGTCVNPTAVPTGRSEPGLTEYSFNCTPKAPIKVTVGTVYWINLTPHFSDLGYGFLSAVEDAPAPNQMGWPNIDYNSYENSSFAGYDYDPTWGVYAQSYPYICYSSGCDEFSVAIAGTYVP